MGYATVEDLLHEMGIPSEDADEDLLQSKLDAAQDIIDRVTARTFEASVDETRLIDCTEETVDGRTLYPPYDLCQITSIVNGDGTAVDVDEYVTLPRLRMVSGGSSVLPAVPDARPWYGITLKLSSGQVWTYDTDPEEAISITGRFAYSVTAPQAIKNACLRLADWLYQQRNDMRDRQESATSDDGILLLMADLPTDIQARLIPFVRV